MNNYLDIILAEGKYAFKVANKANKTEIKQAIEKKFGVKVEKVNITNSHPKKKRVGKYTGMTSKYKKAIVTLKKGETMISFKASRFYIPVLLLGNTTGSKTAGEVPVSKLTR